jgi:hypothetical protein
MIQKTKKYYGITLTLALVMVFVVTPTIAGAATATTTINSSIGSVISLLTTSGTVTANVIPTGAGAQTVASDTVTVSTNNSLGYTLQLADTDATTTLTSGGNSIAASLGSQGAPVVQAVNTWGYRVDGVGSFGPGGSPTTAQSSAPIGTLTFAGVPLNSAPDTLKTTATTASNDVTTVWYGVAANTAQPTGTYTDGVTYTATAN